MSKRKTYNREYKIGAIQMVDQKGMIMREVSEALGIQIIGTGLLLVPFEWRPGKFSGC